MPLLERARVEVYVPDLPTPHYRNLLLSFEEEFTYAFGGCTTVRGLDGSYLSQAGVKTPDRINLIRAVHCTPANATSSNRTFLIPL